MKHDESLVFEESAQYDTWTNGLKYDTKILAYKLPRLNILYQQAVFSDHPNRSQILEMLLELMQQKRDEMRR